MHLQKGFTLLELMIVVIIVGVLATIALGKMTVAIERARAAEAVAELGVLRRAQMYHYQEYGYYAGGTPEDTYPGWGDPDENAQLIYQTPNLQYFKKVLIFNCWTPAQFCVVAEMTRNDDSYHLHIQEDGQIDCSDGGTGLCKKLGFKNEFW